MRKLLVAIALMFVASNAFGAIAGSAHDFPPGSFAATGTGADEICAYCHTPHGSNTAASPLWNKATLSTTNFTAYGTTIAGTTIDNGGVATGVTLLCVSCHDGTVAPGAVSNPPNRGWTDNATLITGNALLNNTMADDHPVGFTYADSITAGADVIADPAAAGFPLFGGEMECSTCHDVHNGAGFDTLLLADNAASAMCQTCHNK